MLARLALIFPIFSAQINHRFIFPITDLALSFHYRIREKDPETETAELKNRAFQSLKKALALRPKDHGLWNVLGVFAAYHEDFGLAQHAFIRSITLQPHPVAWANLGLLYFMQG